MIQGSDINPIAGLDKPPPKANNVSAPQVIREKPIKLNKKNSIDMVFFEKTKAPSVRHYLPHPCSNLFNLSLLIYSSDDDVKCCCTNLY